MSAPQPDPPPAGRRDAAPAPVPQARTATRTWRRLRTVGEILRHYAHRERWFLLPLVGLLVCAGLLLLLTSGVEAFAPFIYVVF